MFEKELGAVCLSTGIFGILAGGGEAVAAMAKAIGGFFSYAAARHVVLIGTASGGILTAVLLFMAGFQETRLRRIKFLTDDFMVVSDGKASWGGLGCALL